MHYPLLVLLDSGLIPLVGFAYFAVEFLIGISNFDRAFGLAGIPVSTVELLV